MKKPWLPPGTAPSLLETERCRLRPLKLTDVIKDYDAVMTSRKEIVGCFGAEVDWPPHDLSLEQDMVDLGWHQKEWELSLSYTFTVESLDAARCLGCVYVMPSEKVGFDAQVIYWARTGEDGLDEHLGAVLKTWLAGSWPFIAIAWPGRAPGWEEWAKLADA